MLIWICVRSATGWGVGVCHGVCVRLRLFGSFLLASASVALRFRSGNYMRVVVC